MQSQANNYACVQNSPANDQVAYTYTPDGEQQTSTLSSGGSQEQSTTDTYDQSGELLTQTTQGAPGQTVESDSLSYTDSSGDYDNGDETSDAFSLSGPSSTNSGTETDAYDADGSLTSEYDGTPSSTTTYSMDAEGNIDAQTSGSTTTDNTYSGQQLSGQTVGSTQTKDLYDAFGNVNCVTVASYAGSTCPAPTTSANPLVELFTYDYKNRQSSDSKYNTSGAITDQVVYTYDALDRVVIQSEFHSSGWTSTWTIYEGDTTTVAREFLYNAQNPGGTPSETKNYAYDPSGNLIALSDSQGSTTNRYTTVTNPQSSVSLLLNQSGSPVQSYGYSAYGQANNTLTQNGSLSATLNPYRFQSKRLDLAFNTYDMGARRYSLTTSRWQQEDQYNDALNNLGLSQDYATSDRYEFGASNPTDNIEVDGHYLENPEERNYCEDHPTHWKACLWAWASEKSAVSLTRGYIAGHTWTPYPGQNIHNAGGWNDGPADAFRHCYWMGILTEVLATQAGYSWNDAATHTYNFGRMHEYGTEPIDGATREQRKMFYLSREMDLYNDRIGIDVVYNNHCDANAICSYCLSQSREGGQLHTLCRGQACEQKKYWERVEKFK